MRLISASLNLLAFLSSGALTGFCSSPYVLHEKRSYVPYGWSLLRRQNASHIIPLRFGLKQSNMDKLEQFLNDVSHPDSPNYGKHWSAGQVAKTFAPSQGAFDTVQTWLINGGIDLNRLKGSRTKAWIQVNTTIEEAERLLQTQYSLYIHDSGRKHIACNAYHLPIHVSPHIEIVTPSIYFDTVLKKHGSTSLPAKGIGLPGVGLTPKTAGKITTLFKDLQNCDKIITPLCLRVLYGFFYQPSASDRNTLGIVEYTPQAYLQSDLDTFAKNFSSEMIGKSPKLVSIDGGVAQTIQEEFDYNGESNLDLQYAMNLVNLVGSKQDVILYQVGDIPQGASFNNFLDALDGTYCSFERGDDPVQDASYPDNYPNGYHNSTDCGITKPANVISTSYGYNEADLSPFYTSRQCAEYAKLGLMGVTVIFSSGDNGVAGNAGVCLNADGSQSDDGQTFNPGFPATCPYVTSVGGTQINPGSNVTQPESACEQVIFSGGGFSNHFAMPAYQKKAVQQYLKKYKPNYPPEIWNSTGISRGYPDLSANGANYAVAVEGNFAPVFGTSAAAPVVASILAMVNDARITAGKKPIGFINPTIYSDMFCNAFHDITSGGNEGCGANGFTAVPGWDPVTGLGTPSFPKLLARWLLLP
ncbi:subtilisin-like protein [Phlegmacium glaucopus]|nr:subtilisin-like protein [Phlegmacium glaucopus]